MGQAPRRWPDSGPVARFRCNAHVDCDRVLRVHLVDGVFIIEGKGEHAPDPNLKRRLNSTLTFDMETRVRESMDQGGRSAGLAVALTNSKVKELKMSGKNPEPVSYTHLTLPTILLV